MLEPNLAFTAPNPVASVGPRERGLDVLVPQDRMNKTARTLLEAMGVSIRPVQWRDVKGPPVYRLLARSRPRLTWMNPEQTEDLLGALKREEDKSRMPDWAQFLLYAWRRGTLTDLDGGIDFGDPGLDISLVLRDLLRYPG